MHILSTQIGASHKGKLRASNSSDTIFCHMLIDFRGHGKRTKSLPLHFSSSVL